MISNKGLSLAQMNAAFPATAIAANSLHVALFKGAMPKISKALDALAPGSVNSLLNFNNITVQLGLLPADFLGSMICPAVTPVVNAQARTVTIPFGGLASTLTPTAAGTPTFFVARVCPPNTTTGFTGFSPAAFLTGPFWIGTVGAQGSDAELQFIGGTLEQGKAYRFLDLTIQL